MDDWAIWLRAVNIFGGLVCLVLLIRAGWAFWNKWNQKTRYYWWALFGWVFFGVEATIEVLIQGDPVRPRTIIQTIVIAWTLRVLAIENGAAKENASFQNPEGDKHD